MPGLYRARFGYDMEPGLQHMDREHIKGAVQRARSNENTKIDADYGRTVLLQSV